MNWLGALLTVISSYICGAMLANGESERLVAFDSMIRLLTYMRRRISTERLPLYRIFSEFEDGYLEEIGFLKGLRTSRRDLDLLWQNAPFFLLTLRYSGDKLVEAILNGSRLSTH